MKQKLRGFFWSSTYRRNKKTLDSLIIAYNHSLHQDYLYALDSLIYIDQIIRDNQLHQFTLPPSTLDKVKNMSFDEVNDSNFKYLLQLIERYGFPSSKNVGLKRASNANIIILHNARLDKNSYFLPYLEKQIELGHFLKHDYEFILWEKEHLD